MSVALSATVDFVQQWIICPLSKPSKKGYKGEDRTVPPGHQPGLRRANGPAIPGPESDAL